MDDKEREKVEAAAKEFWFRTGGHPYGEHIMPDSFARQVAAFHLSETKELRQQLREANEVLKHYANPNRWASAEENTVMDWYAGESNLDHGYKAARAYLEKWRVE